MLREIFFFFKEREENVIVYLEKGDREATTVEHSTEYVRVMESRVQVEGGCTQSRDTSSMFQGRRQRERADLVGVGQIN